MPGVLFGVRLAFGYGIGVGVVLVGESFFDLVPLLVGALWRHCAGSRAPTGHVDLRVSDGFSMANPYPAVNDSIVSPGEAAVRPVWQIRTLFG